MFPLSLNGVVDTSITHTFVDALYVGQKTDFQKITHTKTNGIQTEILDNAPVNTLTGEYKLPVSFLSNELDNDDLNNIAGEYGRKDRIDFLNFSLDRLVLQEILNDYSGTYKKV